MSTPYETKGPAAKGIEQVCFDYGFRKGDLWGFFHPATCSVVFVDIRENEESYGTIFVPHMVDNPTGFAKYSYKEGGNENRSVCFAEINFHDSPSNPDDFLTTFVNASLDKKNRTVEFQWVRGAQVSVGGYFLVCMDLEPNKVGNLTTIESVKRKWTSKGGEVEECRNGDVGYDKLKTYFRFYCGLLNLQQPFDALWMEKKKEITQKKSEIPANNKGERFSSNFVVSLLNLLVSLSDVHPHPLRFLGPGYHAIHNLYRENIKNCDDTFIGMFDPFDLSKIGLVKMGGSNKGLIFIADETLTRGKMVGNRCGIQSPLPPKYNMVNRLVSAAEDNNNIAVCFKAAVLPQPHSHENETSFGYFEVVFPVGPVGVGSGSDRGRVLGFDDISCLVKAWSNLKWEGAYGKLDKGGNHKMHNDSPEQQRYLLYRKGSIWKSAQEAHWD